MAVKEIILSGIFGQEITAQNIREQLSLANGGDVEAVMSSIGGNIGVGIDIYNQFSDYKRKNPNSQMIAKMSGIVGSMMSYLAMNPSFDMVVAEDNAALMVHNAWVPAVGDYLVHEQVAQMLRGFTEPYTKLVSEKMGISIEAASQLMADETWFFGQHIVDAGFASDIVERPQGSIDRTLASAQTEVKAIQAEVAQGLFSEQSLKAVAMIRPPQAIAQTSNNTPTKTKEVSNEMTEEEIQAKADDAVKAEKERVKELMAFRKKCEGTPSAKIVAEIVDKAIDSGEGMEAVNRDVALASMNGNTLAALDSPGATPQASADSLSGEEKKGDETEDEGF